ncbi:hypothetical protein RFI_26665 [Reticulomyxa filosa]|uniref:Uncharacterized protein n=1 Tax=Reticulomyxa filosa TaxID=46433 RepID=X6MAM0_RETFI|nr:hypothetical protein RFI_26665 [Reticulomyxa filosa]|eukprot:ETO10711.1 hypothetical protein RFI_26665 [Reticulomyxa filosa]
MKTIDDCAIRLTSWILLYDNDVGFKMELLSRSKFLFWEQEKKLDHIIFWNSGDNSSTILQMTSWRVSNFGSFNESKHDNQRRLDYLKYDSQENGLNENGRRHHPFEFKSASTVNANQRYQQRTRNRNRPVYQKAFDTYQHVSNFHNNKKWSNNNFKQHDRNRNGNNFNQEQRRDYQRNTLHINTYKYKRNNQCNNYHSDKYRRDENIFCRQNDMQCDQNIIDCDQEPLYSVNQINKQTTQEVDLILQNWVQLSIIRQGWINEFNKIIAKYAKGFKLFKVFPKDPSVLIKKAQFSTDNHKIFVLTRDSIVEIWDIASGKKIQIFKMRNILKDCKELSPDGNIIALYSDGAIRLSDVKSGQELRRFRGHFHGVEIAQFSPDNKYIVTASIDRICLCDVNSGENIDTIVVFSHNLLSAQFSSDGQMILFTLRNKLYLWDIQSGQTKELHEYIYNIQCAALSPDGRYIVFSLYDRDIISNEAQIWDIELGKREKMFENYLSVADFKFFPSGQTIAFLFSGRIIEMWDVKLRQKIQRAEIFDSSYFFNKINISSDVVKGELQYGDNNTNKMFLKMQNCIFDCQKKFLKILLSLNFFKEYNNRYKKGKRTVLLINKCTLKKKSQLLVLDNDHETFYVITETHMNQDKKKQRMNKNLKNSVCLHATMTTIKPREEIKNINFEFLCVLAFFCFSDTDFFYEEIIYKLYSL